MLQGVALYGMNAFMEPICAQNGWDRGEINFSLGIAAFIGQLAMPIAAEISEKFSLRALMGIGALTAAFATCAMGLSASLVLFTCCQILLWTSTQFCGGVVANALMTNWFDRRRGIALGISNSGTNLGGLILPALCMAMIGDFGLEATYLAIGATIFCLAPAGRLIVRNKPENLGLHPDGASTAVPSPKAYPRPPRWQELIRQSAIWRIGLAFGLALMAGAGVMSQLKPRFTNQGMDDSTAMLILTIAAFFGLGAKFFWGFICDKFSPFRACRHIMICCLASMALCWLPGGPLSSAIFGCCIFASIGGLGVVMPNITACYFGASNFLAAYKLISIFILLRSLGFPIMGLSWRLGSNYALADLAFCLSLGIATWLVLGLDQPAVANSTEPGQE